MSLVPIGPGVPDTVAPALSSHEAAIRELAQPSKPTAFVSVDLKANLPDASDWQNCAAICAEINSLVVSTPSGGSWTWLRADGSAL
jgi:hypothetical protein